MTDFDVFWSAWPNRKAKFAAMEAYRKARRVASAAEILAGVEAYKQHLPDDPQFICRATTFLSQGRWMDEYDTPAPKAAVDADWFTECRSVHNGECEGDRMRHHVRMSIERAS